MKELPPIEKPLGSLGFSSSLAMPLLEMDAAVGLPRGFLVRLLDEDDWSFVVKIHAVLEAAVSQLLGEALGDPRLRHALEYLPMGESKTGKLALAASLDLISTQEKKFIKTVSELRNRLAHGIRDIGFTFEAELKHQDKNQKKIFADTCS